MKRVLLICFSLFTSFALNAQSDNEIYYFDRSNSTVEFDFKKIDDYYERLHLLYNISNDDRFVMTSSDEHGLFYISNNDEIIDRHNFKETFDTFYHNCYSDFRMLDKSEISELEGTWRNNVSNMDIVSLMMDIMMRSAPRGNNDSCYKAEPFCTDNGLYTFQAMTGDNHPSESGPAYSCLSSQPCPSWYYMKISTPGAFSIHMMGKDGNTERDIDYCCWGPFDDPVDPCPHNPGPHQNGLTASKVVSCSYSPSYDEHCQIPSSSTTGDYYILIITNYSRARCIITFEKEPGSGPGTTDCSIMPPVMEYSDACYGNTLHLSAHEVSNASYSWTGPNGFTSSLREPHIDNVTFANSGTYSCTVTVPGQGTSDPMTLDIEILPELHADFTVAGAVPGASAQFTGTETTYPTGYTNKITSRTWDFGDGSTAATGTNPTHVYTNPGTYEVTYTIVAENETGWSCEDTKTMPITVSNNLAAAVSSDDSELCEGESTTLRANVSGGTQNYTYTWTPAQSLNNPNTAAPTATPTETTTYKCVVSDGYSEAEGECTVTVHPKYNASTTVDETSCNPYVIDYYNIQTHQWDQMVFNHSYDGIIDLTTTHGCDSLSIDLHFVKLDQANVPLINDDEDRMKEVMPGSSWMPLQYKFEIGDITGGGVEQGFPVEYNWSITYHVDWTGIDNTGTWLLQGNGTNEVSLLVLGAGNATINCDVTTACGTTHREIFVYTDLYGVDENEGEEYVSIYPNPANTSLHIDFDKSVNSEGISIKIYNTAGSLVDEFTTSTSTVERSIQNLSDGLYFIKISGNDLNVIKRLTVVK